MKLYFLPVLLIAGLIFSGCTTREKNVESEYGSFRGGKMRQGHYTSASVDVLPAVKWKFKTSGPIASSAAIGDDKLFFGSADSIFYCLNSISGELLWSLKTNGSINSSPAINDDVVYFSGGDGIFYAVNCKDGSVKWQFKHAGESQYTKPGLHGRQPKDSLFVDDWDFYHSSPAIDGSNIYFGTGSGYFYALDKNSGKEKWKFKTNDVIHSSPALAFGNVYFGSWDTYLYALNTTSGKEVWKFKTGTDTAIYNQTGIQGSPVISEDSLLFFGCRDSHVYALSAIGGNQIWKKFNDFGWVSSSPVVADSMLIYLTGDTKKLEAVHKFTGKSIYSFSTKDMVFSSPALAGGLLYFGELNGLLSAYDVKTGTKKWTFRTEASGKDIYGIQKPDSTSNYEIIFSNEKRNKEHKTSMQMIYSLGSFLSSPVVKDKTIFIGSTDGYFYAFQ